MSRARHKKEHHKRAKGGVVAYTGAGSNVMKEAHERKRGGRVRHMHGEGEESHERHDRKERRRGGRTEHHEHERKHGGRMEHEHEKHRKHGGRVHHRAKGGEVGSNKHPLSTAARTTKLKGEGPENCPSD